ncbi:MAG: DUF1846 domain-containing protein [Lachnospiraceae bacterium]|nr:DUF1846 domain-containing protein [Lachnospiraceae bacterium]
MASIGFDNDKYIKMQSERIRERIGKFGGKLYLEFGGKLFDDLHASRVLPGFMPDSKLRMLLQLKDQAEIVIAVSADALETSKRRGDSGITYDMEVLRLIDMFRSVGLYVGSVVITRNHGYSQAAENLARILKNHEIPVFRHYFINGYPSNVPLIVSEDGFGKNDYIETSRPLVIVTAPGPGSGKLATCLSQVYNENLRGISAGYAKFETFPVWNLPLKHPVNLAYEAATADLSDVNMIDPFHLEAYGEVAVNYNRDVESFPVLSAIFRKIYGTCPYQSPTDMGVNMVGYCISSDTVCREASMQEVIRRYYAALLERISARKATGDEVERIEALMDELEITPEYRQVVVPAQALEQVTNAPSAAIKLHDGTIILGKTKEVFGCASAAVVNALKHLAGIEDSHELVPNTLLNPVQHLKTTYLGSKNPRLHTDEALIAIAVAAGEDVNAGLALAKLPELAGCDMHITVVPSATEMATLRKLKINFTCEPKYSGNRLFRL